jgi:hypothetical protein
VQHHADRGVFITSATFSLPALNLARDHGVTLIDQAALLTLMALTGVGCPAHVPAMSMQAPVLTTSRFQADIPAWGFQNGRVASPPSAPKYCTACGASIDDSTAFCADCGAKIKRLTA